MEFASILSFIGTILSAISSVAPIPGIYLNGKKGAFDLIPVKFLYLNHIAQGLWLLYSLMIEDPGLILVNIATYSLSGVTLVLYIFYSGQLVSFLPMYLGGTLMVSTYVTTMFISSSVGALCALVSIISTIAPMEKIGKVLKTMEHSYIDINLCTCGLANSTTWFLYALIKYDHPNLISMGIAVIVNSVLVTLYFWAKSKTAHLSLP